MLKRRSLLALIGTVILVLSLSVPMMQCAPEEAVEEGEEAVVEEEEEEAVVEVIKYGGRLVAGFRPRTGMENLILDSEWTYTLMGCVFWPMVYDQLWIMGPGPDYAALPSLGTAWETEDGKSWTFRIRDNATWHDGAPVTAEDVAFSLEYLPKADPAFLFSDRICVPGSIRAIDDYTVQFTLEQKMGGVYPPFQWIPIIPKHIWEPYKDNMTAYDNAEAIGSGRFKLKEFKPNEYFWFEANEGYWGGRPYIDELAYKVYGSLDGLYMALKNGEIDMLGYQGCTAAAINDLKETKNIEIIVSPGVSLIWLSFNLYKDGPLQGLNVRKAIMHGIDRDKIIDMLYQGYGGRIDSFIYPESANHNPNLPQYDYDPVLANKLLDNAGYLDTDNDGIRNDPSTGKSMTFEFIVDSSAMDNVKAARLIQEQLVDIGIDITLEALDTVTFLSYLHAPKDGLYDIGITGESPGPYADWIWEFCRSYEAGGEGWNTAYYNNSKFDGLYDKMYTERDVVKRKEYLYEMQVILAEDLPYGFLYRPNELDPVRVDKFEGYVATMAGIADWTNPWTYFKVHLK